jgi:hypothetical protein
MRTHCWWLGLVICGVAQGADSVQEVAADPPSDLAVTVYRSPYRSAGSLELDDLEGFALVRETRVIRIPAGETRVRFEGVADGIEPVSAIVSGLPSGLIERNRDAALLSPGTLVAATAGKAVTLVRSNRRTGKTERVSGTISAANEGVVFHTTDGYEALQCSGFPEEVEFTSTAGLAASPTLSILVRTATPLTQQVTLSYLARGFDWAADYSATLSPDGKTLDLGAWVTLANSNGTGFASAHTQVVAGKLNRETDEVDPIDIGGPIIAQCWPAGTTSDVAVLQIARDSFARSAGAVPMPIAMAAKAGFSLQEVTVTGSRIQQEQLGDLKLYRVPERTTVASRQSKQVRLLDRQAIPVRVIYTALVSPEAREGESQVANVLLRTRNVNESHLGLPLPSGRLSLFERHGEDSLLVNEAPVRDTAINEQVEIDAGTSNDVHVLTVAEETEIDVGAAKTIPLVPGISLRDVSETGVGRTEISNARSSPIEFELRMYLPDGVRVVRADHRVGTKNGQPIFRLTVPANRTVTVRYQLASFKTGVVRP